MQSKNSKLIATTNFITVACKSCIYAIFKVPTEDVYITGVETCLDANYNDDPFAWQTVTAEELNTCHYSNKALKHIDSSPTIGQVIEKINYNKPGRGTHRVVLLFPPEKSIQYSPKKQCTIDYFLSNGEKIQATYNIVATRLKTSGLLQKLQEYLMSKYVEIERLLKFYKDSDAFIDKVSEFSSFICSELSTYKEKSNKILLKRKSPENFLDNKEPKKKSSYLITKKATLFPLEYLQQYAFK